MLIGFDDDVGLAFEERFFGNLRVFLLEIGEDIGAAGDVDEFAEEGVSADGGDAGEGAAGAVEGEKNAGSVQGGCQRGDFVEGVLNLVGEFLSLSRAAESGSDLVDVVKDRFDITHLHLQKGYIFPLAEFDDPFGFALGDNEIRAEGEKAFEIGIDKTAEFFQVGGFGGVIAEVRDADDPVAAFEGENGFGDAGSHADDPPGVSRQGGQRQVRISGEMILGNIAIGQQSYERTQEKK